MDIHELARQHNDIKKKISALQDEKVQIEAFIWEFTDGKNFTDDTVKVTISKSESKTWDQEKLKKIQVEFPFIVDVDYFVSSAKFKGCDPSIQTLLTEALTTKENKPTFKVEFL